MDAAALASWLQLGFAAGVAVYLLTRAIPRLEERSEKRDAAFLAALDKQHVEHKGEVEDARKWASEELRSLRDTLRGDRSTGGGRLG